MTTRSCSSAPENMTKIQSCKSHIPDVEERCGTAQECRAAGPNLLHLPGHVTDSVGLCVHPACKQDGIINASFTCLKKKKKEEEETREHWAGAEWAVVYKREVDRKDKLRPNNHWEY